MKPGTVIQLKKVANGFSVRVWNDESDYTKIEESEFVFHKESQVKKLVGELLKEEKEGNN